MNNNQFPLYHKIYQLLKILYKTVKNFPKEYKYNLGQEMIDLAWKCLDLTVEANLLPNYCKKTKIGELSSAFDRLKLRIRMGQEIDLLSVGQFAHIQENYLLEIGKEIGGWLNWARVSGGGVKRFKIFDL